MNLDELLQKERQKDKKTQGQNNDRKMIKRWYKDDRKMTERRQEDHGTTTERWQNDDWKITER